MEVFFKRAVLAVSVMWLGSVAPVWAGHGNDQRTPDLGECDELQVGAGHKVIYSAYAEGVQIYRWNGTSWTFVAPDAVLYAHRHSDAVIGSHYAGPTWETNSGSYVVGTVLDRCTSNTGAIPWLQLGATQSGGPGVLHGVTFIQRVNTEGGLPPTSPGAFVGDLARVPYTADYYFYRQHH